VLEEAPRLADDGTKLELDGFKMGVNPLAAGSLQGAMQPIAPRMFSFTFGHGGIVQVPVKWHSARLLYSSGRAPVATVCIKLIILYLA
jgi:hypothetical protein